MEVRAKVCLSGVTFRSIILWYHVMLQFDLIHFKGCLEYNEVRFLFLFGVLFLKVHYWFLSCCHPLVCCCIYPALHQISWSSRETRICYMHHCCKRSVSFIVIFLVIPSTCLSFLTSFPSWYQQAYKVMVYNITLQVIIETVCALIFHCYGYPD